jgi:hypothetical protein
MRNGAEARDVRARTGVLRAALRVERPWEAEAEEGSRRRAGRAREEIEYETP